MEHSVKYRFFMSQLTVIKDLKETEKTKISIVSREGYDAPCVLRVCKNKNLSAVYEVLRKHPNPNTAVVYDFVYENGDTYILEELVDGSTVSELLENNGTFTEQRTAKIMIEICNALAVLHNEQPPVVHNDINPSNIKIRDDGSVKLFDFDISRTYKKGQSQNTVLFGTEEFAAPEHYGYGQSEPRTDIYCLGVTMHKMLTGQGLSSEHRIIYKGPLKSIIRRCLEFDPKNRYGSVVALRRDLENFLARKKSVLSAMLGVMLAGILICGLLWGAGKLTAQNGNDAAEAISDTGTSNANKTQEEAMETTDKETINEHETTVPAETKLNDTRKTARMIQLDQVQADMCDANSAKWYKFTALTDKATYRIGVAPKDAPTNTLFPYLTVAVHDAVGIKIDKFDIWSDDEYDFLDLYLEPNEEYFVKISLGGRYDTGNYEVCVSGQICDAGIAKESAAELVLGERYSAMLDSTLSEWYVFRVPETGEYTYTIHNIDVGCDIYFSKQQPGSAGEGNCVENEDNYSGKIQNVQSGELVYFEIYAYDKNPKANGKYIIIIEKSTT